MSEKELLEGSMMNLENDMTNKRIKQIKKEEQRFWAKKIEIPINLHKGLSMLTKDELNEIRKNLDIKGISKLKKSEIVDLFSEIIPEHLENICRNLDEERFKLLVKIAKNHGYINASHFKYSQIRFFRTSGLLFTGKVNGENAFVLPNELIEPLLSLEKNLNVRSVIKRNTEWIQLTNGLLYYYGVLTHLELEKFINENTKEPINTEEYNTVMNSALAYYRDVEENEYGYSHVNVENPEKVRQEHSSRQDVPFYPLSKNQILQASDVDFVERTRSYMDLVNFILQNYKISKEEADVLVEDCIFLIQNGDELGEILNYLGETLEFGNVKLQKSINEKVVHLMNNTRKWYLKGHTPNELSGQEKNIVQPLPQKQVKSKKIGRNEPCPCGSGKKYKKCCGR